MTRNRDRAGTLLVHGRTRKFWLVQWPEGEKRPSHKLGWCDQMTGSQAERAKRQWMEKINQRRELAGDSTTLDGFWQMHYWNKEQQQSGDELVTMRPSTQRDMKCAMHKIWLPRFGPRNMDSIKTSEIQKFLASLIGPRGRGKDRPSNGAEVQIVPQQYLQRSDPPGSRGYPQSCAFGEGCCRRAGETTYVPHSGAGRGYRREANRSSASNGLEAQCVGRQSLRRNPRPAMEERSLGSQHGRSDGIGLGGQFDATQDEEGLPQGSAYTESDGRVEKIQRPEPSRCGPR